MKILAIDPGTTHSAYVFYAGGIIHGHGHVPNQEMLGIVEVPHYDPVTLAVEMIASYGMPVGAEVFETVLWIGRFIQAWQPGQYTKVYRKDIKLHLCGSFRAKDPNVRQAIVDRFGGNKRAKGLKKSPGPLYGIKSHCWAALAVALTVADTTKGIP